MSDNNFNPSVQGGPRRAWQTIYDRSMLDNPDSHATQSVTNSQFNIDQIELGDFQDTSPENNVAATKLTSQAQIFEGGESDDEDNQEDDDICYLDLVRELGSGPIRIDGQIPLGKDIYSLLFTSCLSADLTIYYANQIGVEQKPERGDNPFG